MLRPSSRKSNSCENLLRPQFSGSAPLTLGSQRKSDVLHHSQLGQQFAKLEDHSDMLETKPRSGSRAKLINSYPGNLDLTTIRYSDPGDAMQERRLAGTGRPDNHDNFSGRDMKIKIIDQHPTRYCQSHTFQRNRISHFCASLNATAPRD